MRTVPCSLIFCFAALLSASSLQATDGVCAQCGCAARVRKVCVPKQVEKEIIKVCWDYKCEDICIPGRSIKCGENCLQDECGWWTHGIWKPTCARIKTRRVPVKTEVKRKVPAIEWVVECRCEGCCHAHALASPAAAVPPSVQPQ